MVLISKCLSNSGGASEFKFIGVFKGQNIKKIIVNSNAFTGGCKYIEGQDYLIRIKLGHILKGTLHATAVQSKHLGDL